MRRIETSTLSDQDISSALLTHTYTADADRSVFVRLFADQIAGDGHYVAYLMVQRLGTGSAFRVVPITTAAVEAGVTAIMLTTITVPIKSTDVLTVYLVGLAEDTTTPDITTEIWEDEAVPLIGEPAAGTVSEDLAALNDPSVADIWAGLDAAQLAKFVTEDTGETTAADGSVAKIAQGAANPEAILDELLSGHTTPTTVGAALNRLLSLVAVNRIGPVLGGGLIEIVRGDSYYAADDNALAFEFTEQRSISWDGKTVTIGGVDSAGGAFGWSAECAQVGQTVTVTIQDLDAADTDLAVGVGTWQLEGEPGADGRPITAVEGRVRVKRSLV